MHLAEGGRKSSPPQPGAHRQLHCIFDGFLLSRVHCNSFHTNTNRYDTFLDLSLEVHQSVTVPEALPCFTTLVLDSDNKFECSKCEKKTCATKILTLHSTPRVFQLHLKRFGILEGGGNTKIGHHVTLPELANVDPFTSPGDQHSETPLDYALYEVIVHFGASIWMGHYVAYVKGSAWQMVQDG